MGMPFPSTSGGASLFGSMGYFLQMPDGSIVNFAMTAKLTQIDNTIVATYPNGIKDVFTYASATAAAAAFTGIADAMLAQLAVLSLRSITPATAGGATTVNAVLIGTGFQYDLSGAVFNGTVHVGGSAATIVYVNSNTLLLQFTAPAAGTYDVTYTPVVGSSVKLVNGWVST